MKISTKGRYALRTLIDLAQHSGEGLVPLKDIAARQEISQKYLEQIVTQMSKAGFLQGVRGPQGGYRLARDTRDYNMAEILQTIEGSLAPVSCLETETNQCERCASCATVDMWSGLYKTVTDYLGSITLQDLLDKANTSAGNDYVI
jgi:Rrf2 family protein